MLSTWFGRCRRWLVNARPPPSLVFEIALKAGLDPLPKLPEEALDLLGRRPEIHETGAALLVE